MIVMDRPTTGIATRDIARKLGVPAPKMATYLFRWRDAGVFADPPEQLGTGQPQRWQPRDVVVAAMMHDTVGDQGATVVGPDARYRLAWEIHRATFGASVEIETGSLIIRYEPRWDLVDERADAAAA